MTAATETLTIHTPPETESYELMRLQNAIAERRKNADDARRSVAAIEHALTDLGPSIRRQEILAAAGFGPPNARASQDRRDLEERLTNQRETLAMWLGQIDSIGQTASALPYGPLDQIAAKVLDKPVKNLALEERGVRLVLPQGSKPAALLLFGGRTLEF